MDFDSDFVLNVYILFGFIIGFLTYGLQDLVFQLCSYFQKKKNKENDSEVSKK